MSSLSGKAFSNVVRSFADEAELAFNFLADEFGLSGPDREVIVMPTVAFTGSGIRYRISLDVNDRAVLTQAEKYIGEGRLIAEIAPLVWAAGIGSANEVPRNANTLHNLRLSLVSQARFVRQLHPLVMGSDSQSLMLKAGARHWRG